MSRFKTYAFWVALSSAIVILIQNLGKLLGFEIESGIIENVIMSICGVLVVLGIVSKGNSDTNSAQENVDCKDGVAEDKDSESADNKENFADSESASNKNNDDF